MEKNTPLYLQSFEIAQKNGKEEVEQYIASHKANAKCAEDIGEAINSHFDGFHYHTGFEEELIKTYGIERVQYVVAYNIQQNLQDGRISKENKTWALQSQMNQGEGNPKPEYTIHTHSGLLDFFSRIGLFRLELEQASWTCKGHCEIDKYANMSYQAMHHPKEGEWFEEDITKVSAQSLPDVDL